MLQLSGAGWTQPLIISLFSSLSLGLVGSLCLSQSLAGGDAAAAAEEKTAAEPTSEDVRQDAEIMARLDALVAEMPVYFDWLVEDQMADEIVYLNEGKAENPFDVYAREDEPCSRCEAEIERMTFNGRSTYYCPSCQPSP